MKPIKVIPYGANLLRTLAEEIVRRFYIPEDPLSLARLTVIFPHRRPALFLKHYLFEILGKGFIPPKTYSIEDFVKELALRVESPPGRQLTLPDRVWLLYRCATDTGTLKANEEDFASFFPWGVRLSQLFEEFFKEMKEPLPLPHPEGVPQRARELLEDLRLLWSAYEEALSRGQMTTPGRRLREVASMIEKLPLQGEGTFIVGFYALTRAEDKILRCLWEKGAEVIWQAPRDLLPLYRRWRDSWGADLDFAGPEGVSRPKIHFIEAYDTHSQITEAVKALGENQGRGFEALVLPDPSSLIPLLYELTDREVNVTLGYPLERTALWGLLDQLIRLQEGFDPSRGYYHKDYLATIRHPFLKRLLTPSGKEGGIILHLIEERIREVGRPYFHLEEVEDLIDKGTETFLALEGVDLAEARAFLREIHQRIIRPWRGIRTARELALTVEGILSFIFGSPLKAGHPLENEFLYTLQEELLPALKGSLFADEPVSQSLLFSLFRQIVSVTRTPFEGEPLVALQILGLLETRLLKFDRVIVIDLNEGVLPSHEEVDPLLPPSLRPSLGLPEREREEEIVRYHFERLIYSAQEAYLIWQSSTSLSTEGLEGKTSRSRFVERLLWEEELRRGKLLEDEIRKPALTIPPSHFLPKEGIPKDRKRVWTKVFSLSQGKGLSASLLNTYIRCPLKFYYKYILGLEPPVEVLEEVEGDILGQVIHRALEEYFAPFLGRVYDPSRDNDLERLFGLFLKNFNRSPLSVLGPEKRFFIEEVVRYRLERFLQEMRDPFVILALEEEISLRLDFLGTEWNFSGRVDRIDLRKDTKVIVDYKTGRPERRRSFPAMVDFIPPEDLHYEQLREINRKVPDLQLQLYVLLLTKGKSAELGRTTAVYLNLAEGNREMEFFLIKPQDLAREERRRTWIQWSREGFPKLLQYLLRHILESPLYFRATEEEYCRFCEYEPSCHYAW